MIAAISACSRPTTEEWEDRLMPTVGAARKEQKAWNIGGSWGRPKRVVAPLVRRRLRKQEKTRVRRQLKGLRKETL